MPVVCGVMRAIILGKDTATCPYCSKILSRSFIKRHILYTHLQSEEQRIACELCGAIVKNKNSLYKHRSMLHRDYQNSSFQ